MNTKKEKCYNIIAGPNKDKLFDALKYACSKGTRIPVEFVVALGYTMPKGDPGRAVVPMHTTDFKIMGIEDKDGSGESFNLHGYCKADLCSFGTPTYRSYRFKAYYNTKRRSGTITFIE